MRQTAHCIKRYGKGEAGIESRSQNTCFRVERKGYGIMTSTRCMETEGKRICLERAGERRYSARFGVSFFIAEKDSGTHQKGIVL